MARRPATPKAAALEAAGAPEVAASSATKGPTSAGPSDISDPVMRAEVRRAAVWIAMVGATALAVELAQPLLVIFGGMVFAAIIDGGTRLLGRVLPVRRGIRVALVVIGGFGFIAWTVVFAGSQLADQAAALPATVGKQALRGLGWLRQHGVAIDIKHLQGITDHLASGVSQLTSAVGGVLGALTTVLAILVLGLFIAAEPKLYRRGVAWMLPIAEREHFNVTANAMGRTLRMLMFGRMVGMVAEGLVTFILLALYSVPMAGLLGLITGLMAFLPNVGALISGVLMVLVGFSAGTNEGIYCIGVYALVHLIDGNVVAPLVAKRTADLAPALVLGMQLIMGTLFGLLGFVLADPLLATLKIALERQSLRNRAEADTASDAA